MKYHVCIYPCSGDTGQPSSEVRMEIAGGFRLFYEDAMGMIGKFHEHAKPTGSEADAKFRVSDGEGGKDLTVCCDETDIIYSLLYCCKNHSDVTVREILYQGNRYTDISDVRFWVDDFNCYTYGRGSIVDNLCKVTIGVHARKNGNDTQVYLFGPYFYLYPGSGCTEEMGISSYPPSYGIVEVKDGQTRYAGAYFYESLAMWNADIDEFGEIVYVEIEQHEDVGAEVFLSTDGKKVTFSILRNGKFYRKISRDEEKIIFYSALRDGSLLNEKHFESHFNYYASDPKDEVMRYHSDPEESLSLSFWECTDGEDVVFEKGSDGEYRYAGENKDVAKIWEGFSFVPPRTPDPGSLNQTSAHRLCEEYVNIFYTRKPAEHPEDQAAAGHPEDQAAAEHPESQKAAGQPGAERDFEAITAMKKRLLVRLKEEVMGQDLAVEKFVNGYIRYRILGRMPGKPAGVFLFAGPPGTGKTYLAETFVKLIADEGYEYRRFDMAAYGGNREDASGLVGFERTWMNAQPGQLTEFVKRNPKCVLLFDEIEKACTEVRRLFLSILEGAVLTDKYLDTPVSFEDAILIFTTNEGTDLYEDNRGTNLTALPDSAVREGLEASDFAPELLSRFMSGTIVMFNHLSYPNLSNIFKNSMEDAVEQIRRDDLKFELTYDGNLPKLYLLSKGDRIDARFVSANARKMTLDLFLDMAEKWPRELKNLQKVTVSVDVTDEVRKYFELTDRPRILGYGKDCQEVFTGVIEHLREGFLPEGGPEKLGRIADAVWEDSEEGFQKRLEECNWNSRSKEEKYDTILIDLGVAPEKDGDPEGYACLKAAVELKRDIPIIIVGGKTAEEKTPLLSLGATDFVRGCRLQNIQVGDENRERGSLALDREELEEIFSRQHFVEMAKGLARERKRISAAPALEYKKEAREVTLRFTNLSVKAATEEDAETRRQNRKYLLAEKPQVRLGDVFGNQLARDAVELCIDNIKNPGKYQDVGTMKGILMYGAPGTGKTMFAKAMAFESGVAFISAVGADFLGGNGIAKMEEVFRTARRKRPCILFIDEFDAISRDRSIGIASSQESVLEKFLKEMDGLETDNDGVYVVGATNYPLEALDGAVIRRFSEKIEFLYPNMEERQEFLLYVLEKNGLEDTISDRAAWTLNMMMRNKSNYSEIEDFIEESIRQARYRGRTVTEKFLLDRIRDETDGVARQGVYRDSQMGTAYHEAGHAVLMSYFGRKIDYVTIVSRGNYGGYAMALPNLHTGQDFLVQICILLAGRVAETILMGDKAGTNVGADSDLQKATQYAYEYVCRHGLSGRLTVVPWAFALQTGERPEAALPETEREAIWAYVEKVLQQQKENTIRLLQQRWEEVSALAVSLLYTGELSGDKAEEAIRNRIPCVEEDWFPNSGNDYVPVDNAGTTVPFGYPIYPYSPYLQDTAKPEDEGAEGTDPEYFYAVKEAAKGLGIFADLKKAFAVAYNNRDKGVCCRRFRSRRAAQEYLAVLELKAFRWGKQRFFGFYTDALAEMYDSRVAEKRVVVLKGEVTALYQEQADRRGMPLALYLINMAQGILEERTSIYLVIQIYDKELQEEFLQYMEAREIQAKQYLRNSGYEE